MAGENPAGQVVPAPAVMPTVGRVVYFKLSADEAKVFNNGAEIAPAIITRVWNETCVNLKVLCDGSYDLWKTSVSKGESQYNWDWMPFQKDQQARLAKEAA